MSSREEIAARHGIPDQAHKLVGETAPELEADAAARAAIKQMFGSRDLNVEEPKPPEPPIEGLSPKDKPIADYTEAEREAASKKFDRTMAEVAERDAQERREAQARAQAEANLTPDQVVAGQVRDALAPGAKDARNVALLASLGLLEQEDG